MKITTKKQILIFSDGSLNFDSTIIKRSKKINFFSKDHKNFILNKKNSNSLFIQHNAKDFRTKFSFHTT